MYLTSDVPISYMNVSAKGHEPENGDLVSVVTLLVIVILSLCLSYLSRNTSAGGITSVHFIF